MFQHQLNIVRSVWRRLEWWRGLRNVSTTSFANAPTDKLRVLEETLLDILLYTVYEIGPVPTVRIPILNVQSYMINCQNNKIIYAFDI